jgi:hypothetical protein
MLLKSSCKTLKQFSQKAHENGAASMACLRWKKIKRKDKPKTSK